MCFTFQSPGLYGRTPWQLKGIWPNLRHARIALAIYLAKLNADRRSKGLRCLTIKDVFIAVYR